MAGDAGGWENIQSGDFNIWQKTYVSGNMAMGARQIKYFWIKIDLRLEVGRNIL
jgi:hypothetical protein